MNELSHIDEVTSGVPQGSHLYFTFTFHTINKQSTSSNTLLFFCAPMTLKFVAPIPIGTVNHNFTLTSTNFRSGASFS